MNTQILFFISYLLFFPALRQGILKKEHRQGLDILFFGLLLSLTAFLFTRPRNQDQPVVYTYFFGMQIFFLLLTGWKIISYQRATRLRATYFRNYFPPLKKENTELAQQVSQLEKQNRFYRENIINKFFSLYRISRQMESTLNLPEMFNLTKQVLELNIPLLKYVLIWEKMTVHQLVIGCWSGIEEGRREQIIPALEKGWGKINQEKLYLQLIEGRPYTLFPVVARDQILGEIVCEGTLSEKNINDLQIISQQVALGLRKAELYEQVLQLSRVDGLTGLYVHRYFQEKLDLEVKRGQRYKNAFSFLMVDIDYFKKFNDRYGHQVGDEVLKKVALVLKENIYETDFVARYGGEEFAIIMPMAGKDSAFRKAELIRRRMEESPFLVNREDVRITLSIGLAEFPSDAQDKTSLIKNADAALYRAKESGRNRVVVFNATDQE